MLKKFRNSAYVIFVFFFFIACSKEKRQSTTDNKASIKTVIYSVKGTNFRIDYIDSNSVYQSNLVFKDSFLYKFQKGSGAGIGISIHLQSPSDTIYSWNILINGNLYANAFSEGGAYFTVPYN